jgi:hypothetical protein
VALRQLNVRVPEDLLEKFRRGAKRRGLSQSEYLRFLTQKDLEIPAKDLKSVLPPAPSPSPAPADTQGEPAANGASSQAPAAAGSDLDTAQWLSGRARIPLPLARRAVSAGNLEIDGVAVYSSRVDRSRLRDGAVTLNGRPI